MRALTSDERGAAIRCVLTDSTFSSPTGHFGQSTSKMGGKFGNLYYIRNILYYKLSPHELKAFGNFWSSSLRGVKRDLSANVPYILPPFVLFYYTINWAKKENDKFSRKKPGQYDNDEWG